MKKIIVSLAFLFVVILGAQAQKYFTREGKVTFSSDASMEKIEARNSSATCVVDTESGKMEFAVLIKAFQFEKALMQEHFNENYMESGKFPKAIFKGDLVNKNEVDFSKPGVYTAKVKGNMTIHGVTQPLETAGTITVGKDKITLASEFEVKIADYNIIIPAVVKDNIAKNVKITVAMECLPLAKGS